MATCFHCENEATKLCDYHLGCVIGDYVREGGVHANRFHAVMTMETKEQFYRCDRELCDDCATTKGHLFACGKEGFTDTYDYCKTHAPMEHSNVHAPMLTESEAARVKYELHIRLTPPRGKLEAIDTGTQPSTT